jgi:Uma2 family endonuclease
MTMTDLTLPRYKLTVDDYHRMGETGILNEDSRVELIEGELIEMAPIGSQHASVVSILMALLVPQCAGLAIVSTQNSVQLSQHNEPQPDLMLLKPRTDWYRYALPTAADVLLVIEVADTTLAQDRKFKSLLYARHGIPEYWVVNLVDGLLEIYQEPSSDGYRRASRGESTVSPLLLPDIKITLADLWL